MARNRRRDLPSFEEVTAKPQHPETLARLHPSALPNHAPPGDMRVYGRNPALKWLQGLERYDPVLSDEVYQQLEPLYGEPRRQALWSIYMQHYYAAEQAGAPLMMARAAPDFDFNLFFELPSAK